VEAEGGEAVFGWKVEVWQRILVKFIGHSVWRVSGDLMCITPQPENRILFLQDDSFSFDYGQNSRMGRWSCPRLTGHLDGLLGADELSWRAHPEP
jgi:hypothetical protein